MIREDRTWEYLETHTELNPLTAAETNRNTLFRMKFDGNEEKNGKKYSRFVYCGDRSSWTSTVDYRTGATTSSDRVTVPNEDATVYYLREEPGKVFILFPYEDYVDYSGNGYKVKKGEEVLLYDFTLSEGESFTGFWSYGNFQGGLIDYPVRALDPVKIAGGMPCVRSHGQVYRCMQGLPLRRRGRMSELRHIGHTGRCRENLRLFQHRLPPAENI